MTLADIIEGAVSATGSVAWLLCGYIVAVYVMTSSYRGKL